MRRPSEKGGGASELVWLLVFLFFVIFFFNVGKESHFQKGRTICRRSTNCKSTRSVMLYKHTCGTRFLLRRMPLKHIILKITFIELVGKKPVDTAENDV